MTTPTHRIRMAVHLARTLAGDTPPNAEQLRTVADAAGVHVKTVRRWLADARPITQLDTDCPGAAPVGAAATSGRSRWIPSEHQLAVVAGSTNLMTAWRDLASTDPSLPSYPTFRRAIAAMDAGISAAVTRRGGTPALVSKRVYLTVNAPHRNARWVMDSQEIPVRVLGPRNTQPRKYWQTTALDEATRMVMATVISAERPTSGDVAACIATGIRGRHLPDGTFVGGVPEQIVWDNAREFLADQVTEMALALAFTGTAVTPYAPYEKGKIESWHRTIQSELYDGLPGATHGPTSFSGRQYWATDERSMLTEALLVAYSLSWVEQYNDTRAHSGLSGVTPLQAWRADPHPLRVVPDEALYDAMLAAAQPRKVGKAGIRFRNTDYYAPELNAFVGRKLLVRYLPHELDAIEVFDGHTHIATAIAADKLTGEDRSELLRARREQYLQAKGLLAEGARLRQERHDEALAANAATLGPLAAVAPAGARAENVAALAALYDRADTGTDTALPDTQSRDTDETLAVAARALIDPGLAQVLALFDKAGTATDTHPGDTR